MTRARRSSPFSRWSRSRRIAACAPVDEEPDDDAVDPTPTAADQCATEQLPLLEPGTLTIGTDSPAFPPWFKGNDPTNGKGYESAVAYAVAEELGFTDDQVTWVTVPFNTSYKPGEKDFDFDINQISITPERAEVVDFSDGYYEAAQAVIALEDTPVADATSVADLADYNLGAQTGTTSLTAIRDVIQPDERPGRLRGHQRRQAGAAERPGRRRSSPTCRPPSTSPRSRSRRRR